MKKGLRFIIAFLTLASLGTWFLPAAEAMGGKVSIADVLIKAGIGYYDKTGIAAEIYGFLQTYLGIYVWFIAASAGLVVIEAVLIAVLRRRAAYVTALIISVINIGAFLALFFLFEMKLGEVEAVLGGLVKISCLALFAWIAVYALNVILAVIGIILWRAPKENDGEEIYLEQINRAETERARRRQTRDQERVRRESARQAQLPHNVPPRPHKVTRTSDGQEGNPDPCVWAAPEKGIPTPVQERQSAEHPEPYRSNDNQPKPAGDFTGAITGENGLYSGKVYRLKDKKEVFFVMEGTDAVLTPYEEDGAAAGVYYIAEYGEYCVEPFEKNKVFLGSGQPLGKGRQYYLPRGSKVCIGNPENRFILD